MCVKTVQDLFYWHPCSCSVTADPSWQCIHRESVNVCMCLDLLAKLVPRKIKGPEQRALPLIGGWEGDDMIPTQSQWDHSLMGTEVRYSQTSAFSFSGQTAGTLYPGLKFLWCNENTRHPNPTHCVLLSAGPSLLWCYSIVVLFLVLETNILKYDDAAFIILLKQ